MEIHRLSAAEAKAALPELVDLLRQCVEQGASVGFVLPLGESEIEEFWQGVLQSFDQRVLLVARQAGQIVGSVQLELSKKANGVHRAEVQKLLVQPAARQQGIASRLMQAIEAEARAEKRSLLVLDTVEGSIAEHLYRKQGYVAVGAIPQFAIAPDQQSLIPTMVMYRILA